MNLQKLEALVTAIDLGSFSRAAETLGYTQSGLTHMMNSLEDELGFALIRRGYFGVRPTEEGERLLPGIRRLLAMERELAEEVRHIKKGGDACLRVGALPSLSACWLPPILSALYRELPELSVEVSGGGESELSEALFSGRLDLAFTVGSDASCEFLPLYEEALYAVLPLGHRAAGYEAVSLDTLLGERLLSSALSEGGERMREQVGQPALEDAAILSMVEHGLGVAILPALSIRGWEGRVCALPLSPQRGRSLGIALAPGKRPSEAARRLIALSRRFIDSVTEEV